MLFSISTGLCLIYALFIGADFVLLGVSALALRAVKIKLLSPLLLLLITPHSLLALNYGSQANFPLSATIGLVLAGVVSMLMGCLLLKAIKAKKAISRISAKANTMINALADSVILTDHLGVIQSANHACLAQFNTPLNAMLGKNVAEFTQFSAIMQHERNALDEVQIAKPSGACFPATVQMFDVPDEDTHTCIAKVFVIHDLTQTKATQAHINLLSRALACCPLSVWVSDQHGKLKYINHHLTDVDQDQENQQDVNVLGQLPSLFSHIHESIKEVFYQVDSKGAWSREYALDENEEQWRRVTLGMMEDEGSHLKSYIAIEEDISNRVKAHKRQKLAEVVFDSSSEAIVVTDKRGFVILVNRAFSEITGFSKEEVVGNVIDIFSQEKNSQGFDKVIDELTKEGHWQGEMWGKRKNHMVYPMWLLMSVAYNDKGQYDGYVATFSDITHRKQDEYRMWRAANFDPLTQLANRSLFQDRCGQAIVRNQRLRTLSAVVFIDLDRFKHVNDTLGHHFGDLLLKQTALRILSVVRKTDTVSRFGGDEFAVLLLELHHKDEVTEIIQKMLNKLVLPYWLEGHEVYVSASMGAALIPHDGKDTETLMRNADAAMYRAKQNGRNQFFFYDADMAQASQQHSQIEIELHKALEREEFELRYQPIVAANSTEMVSCEALLRWHCHSLGDVSPSDFIPVAEEVGEIVSIGAWVMRQACETGQHLREQMGREVSMSVNISSMQFHKGDVPQMVADALSYSGFPAKNLTLEITESLIMRDDTSTAEQLKALRELGVRIAIDDFGTGYSSLSYLKKFPLDTLKIDQSFVRDICTDPEDRVLISSIITMAQTLGLHVVAEGVETKEQEFFLRNQGCNYLQGFYYGKDFNAADILTFAANH